MKAKSADEQRAVLYYPEAFKRHYMDVLACFRDDLAERSGKPVGWQAIRDMVMQPEDERLTAELSGERDRIKVDSTRPRSPLVTLEDFKGWYHPRKSHVPSDIKFQYIERFVRSLRISGKIDEIERELDLAQGEYIRDALHLFYRPVPFAGTKVVIREDWLGTVKRLVSSACFRLKAESLGIGGGDDDGDAECFLILREYHGSHVTPLDIVVMQPSGDGERKQMPLYTGFLVSESILSMFPEEGVILIGKLILTKESGASPGDDGTRALSDGGTYSSWASFSPDAVKLDLGTGEDLGLMGPVFGVDVGGEQQNLSVGLKRIERDEEIDSIVSRLAYRYRTWP